MNHDPSLDIAAHLVQARQYAQAESLLIPIVQTAPHHPKAWQLLAQISTETGKYTQGLFAAWQANSLQDSADMQALFARCLNHVAITAHDPQLQTAVARAVAETWGAPAELAEQAGKLLKHDPLIQKHLPPRDDAHLTADDIAALNQHALLHALLQSAPVCDLALEGFLTTLRKTLLLNPECVKHALPLAASLAQQCFINEYIYPVSAAESTALQTLRTTVRNTPHPTPEQRVLLACYHPLHRIEGTDDWLHLAWPQPVDAILRQQIREPQTEAQLAAAMPTLTPISDGISQAVQAMYEESPYPRWVRAPKAGAPQSLNAFLSTAFPLSAFTPLACDNPLHVLIAGGGTGQHPLHTAQRFTGAQVQVIDLSRRSLAYAQRKTQELGLNNLQFAQADILQLPQIDERFDLIESVGVLHHMADPWAGWEALLTRLKPNGLMKLGFYSQTARQEINQLRDFINAQGFGNSPEAIRTSRQHLIAHSHAAHIDGIFRLRDFYSTSACRDLLFHVQEHQLTLPEIDAFLQSHGLRFIGFETSTHTLNSYRKEFPEDPAATNLSNWHTFEQRHPETFISMYQLWVQKVTSAP